MTLTFRNTTVVVCAFRAPTSGVSTRPGAPYVMKASMSLIKREVQPLVGGGYETSPEGSGPFRTCGKAHSKFNYLAKKLVSTKRVLGGILALTILWVPAAHSQLA